MRLYFFCFLDNDKWGTKLNVIVGREVDVVMSIISLIMGGVEASYGVFLFR